MLKYEHGRTADIVHRMMSLLQLVRVVIILVALVLIAALGSVLGRIAGIGYIGGGLLGVVIGLVLGSFVASLVTIGMEWMAQMLIAQGEIIAAQRPGQETEDERVSPPETV